MELRPEIVTRMAIELEKSGIALYANMARGFPEGSDERRLLEHLRNEEANHLAFFEEMDRQIMEKGAAVQVLSRIQGERIHQLMDDKILRQYQDRMRTLVTEGDMTQILLFAAMIEIDTARYYRSMEGFLSVTDRKILEGIIAEESSHKDVLLDMLCRSRRFNRVDTMKKVFSQNSIGNYRETELRDLALLNQVLHSLVERSESDVVTLIMGSLENFRKLADPEMLLLFIFTEQSGACVLREAQKKGERLGINPVQIPLENLTAKISVAKNDSVLIKDESMIAALRDSWDLRFCAEQDVKPADVILLPIPGVGILEMVNVRTEFVLSGVNTLLLEVIAGIIRVLSLGKIGLDRLGSFYRFFSFAESETTVEEIHSRTLQFSVQELKSGIAAVFSFSTDRKKIFLASGYNFDFSEVQFAPESADRSIGRTTPRTSSVTFGSAGAVDHSIPEIAILERARGIPVENFLASVLRDEQGEVSGLLMVCGKPEGYSSQDGEILDFFARQLSQLLIKRKQMREIARMQKEGAFLARYFSPNLLKRLKKGEQIHKEGSVEEIVVLFADIRGFTTMSEKLDPRGIVNLLNGYFGRMVNIILQNDGVIDKFIGDAVFVYWGVPVRHKNDTLLAALTAIAMQEEIKFMKSKDILPPDFHIGIGVHKGPAILGNIGSEERLEFTAIGDTVNTASRLCGIAPGDEIIVSGPVYKEIFFDLEVVPFGKKILTGKTQEILTYRVQSLKEDFFETYVKAF
jgi:class 3 adenylate cyclase/rubrerythrin